MFLFINECKKKKTNTFFSLTFTRCISANSSTTPGFVIADSSECLVFPQGCEEGPPTGLKISSSWPLCVICLVFGYVTIVEIFNKTFFSYILLLQGREQSIFRCQVCISLQLAVDWMLGAISDRCIFHSTGIHFWERTGCPALCSGSVPAWARVINVGTNVFFAVVSDFFFCVHKIFSGAFWQSCSCFLMRGDLTQLIY